MLVSEVMTAQVVTISPDDTIAMAKELLDKRRFHHLMVVEDNLLLGVISDKDLLKWLSPYVGTDAETTRDTSLLNKKIHQIMSRRLITVQPETSLKQAIEVMVTSNVSCLPVVNAQNHLEGILSWRDLLAAAHTVLMGF